MVRTSTLPYPEYGDYASSSGPAATGGMAAEHLHGDVARVLVGRTDALHLLQAQRPTMAFRSKSPRRALEGSST
jgi:hypothetical protein